MECKEIVEKDQDIKTTNPQGQQGKQRELTKYYKKYDQLVILNKITLQQSPYLGRPDTIFFPYPDICNLKRQKTFLVQNKDGLPLMTYKTPIF